MGMRKDLRHWDADEIKGEVHRCLPRLELDIVQKCYKFGCGDMHLDWHCGHYTQITQSVIENPEFQSFVNECRSRAELVWDGGQACIRVVCISGDLRQASVVSSTLQAVFQQAGYSSKGPLELFCYDSMECEPNEHSPTR